MSRLPVPGGDNGNWGDILNDFLVQSHDTDGTLKPGSVGASQLGSDTVTDKAIADGSITEALLSSSLQAKLDKSTSWSDVADKPAVISAGTDKSAARSAIGAGTSNLTIGTTSVTAAAGNDSRITGALQASDNLADVADMTTARANLEIPTAIPIRFAAATALTGVTPSDRAYVARTLSGARMRVASAPVGSALTVDIEHFDGFSWSNIDTIEISDGSSTEAVEVFTQAQDVGDMLRLDVTSVGSTTPATGVIVDVLWT